MMFYKMPLNTKNLKNTKMLIMKYLLILFLIKTFNIFSQVNQYDKPQRIKVDGVSAVVGDYIILESDIDKAIVEMDSQGMSGKNITRCELLGKLMEDKLYAHNAIQDSLEVTDQEIYDYVDQSIAYFTDQLGSIEKVLEFYRKPDELSFRDELFQINKIQKLSSMMQSKIVDDIEITPEEVRSFFKQIPMNELPTFGTELEISQPENSETQPEIQSETRNANLNQNQDGANNSREHYIASDNPFLMGSDVETNLPPSDQSMTIENSPTLDEEIDIDLEQSFERRP